MEASEESSSQSHPIVPHPGNHRLKSLPKFDAGCAIEKWRTEMKVYVSAVIILLFSLGGLAAGVQAVHEDGTTPPPLATPSNGSRAKRQVDQPAAKGAETPSPAQAASHQQTVSPDLEKSLVGLTEAVTKLVDKQSEKESVPVKFS